jgi:hypothetical protein
LNWGIISEVNSDINTIKDLKNKNFGISRLVKEKIFNLISQGSGSHIMSYLLSKSQNWDTEKDIKFVGN